MVYGFGKNPMLLVTNLEIQETFQKKKLCIIVTKVYLMRWRIEEYFRFKKQQFNFEDLRVMSLNPIRNLNYKIPKFVFYATGYAFKQIFSKTSSGIMNYFRKHALPCHQFPANHIKNGA